MMLPCVSQASTQVNATTTTVGSRRRRRLTGTWLNDLSVAFASATDGATVEPRAAKEDVEASRKGEAGLQGLYGTGPISLLTFVTDCRNCDWGDFRGRSGLPGQKKLRRRDTDEVRSHYGCARRSERRRSNR